MTMYQGENFGYYEIWTKKIIIINKINKKNNGKRIKLLMRWKLMYQKKKEKKNHVPRMHNVKLLIKMLSLTYRNDEWTGTNA